MNSFMIISGILGLAVPIVMVVGSIVLVIVKIVERKKEKQSEDIDKYKKY